MGDLNFRLVEEYEKTPEEIDRAIKKGDLVELFQFDQLRYVMRKGEAFSELHETNPSFPPTFKYEVGTNKYDYKYVIFTFLVVLNKMYIKEKQFRNVKHFNTNFLS